MTPISFKKFIKESKACFLSGLALCVLISGCGTTLDNISSLYDDTVGRYERLLQKQPENEALRLKLARFYYQFKDYERTKELLQGLEDKPAKILLAKTLTQLKEHTQALELFDRIGEVRDREYIFLYAQALEEKNLFPRAIKMYEKIKPPFKEKAQERINQIKITIDEKMPFEVSELLKEQEEFLSRIEDEEAVILLVDEEAEIKEDNTALSSVHVIEKVLKEKGRSLAEVVIGYDSTDERVELEYARTITPEGKVVYVGKENIRDVSKYLNYPLYSNARAFIISMPAVEIGAIVEYKVKIYSSKLINEDDFTYIYRLRERYPVGQARFKLTVPPTRTPNLKLFHKEEAGIHPLLPQQEPLKDKKAYIWEFKEIEPIIPEDKMPPLPRVNPAVIISSFESWKEVYSWWHDLFKDKTALSNEIKKFVDELIEGIDDDLEKARKIYEFCTKEVRYVAVEYGESGYEPHSAQDIFWNRYGDCKDMATLLVGMLRYAGLDAYPVLIPTRGVYPIAFDFASVNFNHAIAALFYKGEFIFMDATSSTTSFGDLPLSDQDRDVLVFLKDGYKLTKIPLLRENEVLYRTDIEIDRNEDAHIEREVTTTGYFAATQRYYFRHTHPDEIEENIQSRMAEISPFSELIDYAIENADEFDKLPVLRYTFKAKKFLSPAHNLRIVPSLEDITIDTAYAGKKERNFAIDFSGISRRISRIKIKLPPNLKLQYAPSSRRIRTKWFDFKLNFSRKRNIIDFEHEFKIKERFVPKSEYARFKKKLEEVLFYLKEKIILARK
ncbi:MAG: DUF3857 domain-containing protein [Candidatus Omnitrophota bacterium]|nr:MAG: DUF3857 domain-containing protein [Candidatus Omnitrophota bacterium]